MLKLLRKYDKWILAIGGSLLMVVFLLPQALQKIGGDPRDKVIATFANQSITVRERFQAQSEIELLKALHPSIPYLLLGLDQSGDEALHWILLGEEARRAGFVAGPEDGAQFMGLAARELGQLNVQQTFGSSGDVNDQLIAYFVDGFYQQMLLHRQGLIDGGRVFEQGLAQIEAVAMGILRLHKSYFETPRLSDVESVAFAKAQADQVAVDYMILRPTRILQGIEMPLEADVQAHFDEYRDVVPGEGINGAGYRLFPGVKVEWLSVKREQIAETLSVDPIEANAHWRQNRSQYGNSWVQAREEVEADLLDTQTDQVLADIQRFMVGEIRKRERSLPDDGVFKTLPDDWDLIRPSLEVTANNAIRQVEEMRGANLPEFPFATPSAVFLLEEDMSRLEGINDSSMQQGPASIPFATLAFSAREINPDSTYGIQVGRIYGPLTDADRNHYYFVLTEARPTQPAVLDRVTLARVRMHLRRNEAMEILLDGADNYVAEVSAKGVIGFADDLGINPIDVGERVAVLRGRVNPVQTADFDIESVRHAILDRADTLDPTILASQLPAQSRTLVLPSPKAQSVIIVEIIDNRPLTVEGYRVNVDRAEALADRDLFFSAVDQWPFSWPALSERMQFVRFSDDGDDVTDAEAATADASATD